MRTGTAIVLAAAILAFGSISTATILVLGLRASVSKVTADPNESPSPSTSVTPTSTPSGTPTFVGPFPPAHKPDPTLNFVGGDFITDSGFTECRVHVNFMATSRADGTNVSGTYVETVVGGGGSCEGQVTAQISCLIVRGNFAEFDGWAENPTGIFNSAGIIMGTVTENDPDPTYGQVNRVGLGIAGGGPECPPPINGKGPMIRSGTIVVAAASPQASPQG